MDSSPAVEIITPASVLYPAYMALRYRVLRQPLGYPPGTETDADDLLPTSIHFALLAEGDVLGCVRLQPEGRPGLGWLRYMATETACQSKGLGRILITALEAEAARLGYKAITLFAREHAVGFYLACGYTQQEETPVQLNIRHWRMGKIV